MLAVSRLAQVAIRSSRVTPVRRTDISVISTTGLPSAYISASTIANGSGSYPSCLIETSYVTSLVVSRTCPRHFSRLRTPISG